MVAAVDEKLSEGRVFTITGGKTVGLLASEGRVFSIYNFPSIGVQASEDQIKVTVKAGSPIDVSEARVFAVVRGRLENHKVRAFPARLDGHDFVFLRLGENDTLVWDFTTKQWTRWSSEVDNNVWRPSVGNNWTGMGKPFYDDGAMSDVILGDDTFGLLWTLNPDSGIDQHPDPLRSDLPYIRKVVGGLSMRLRETLKCGAVYLTADVGTPQVTDATISLRTSDDYGKTWQPQGTITVEPGNYDQEFAWRALGLIKAPGRIFEITDNGATVRIDSMDMR